MSPNPSAPGGEAIVEPLAESAPLARVLAATHCADGAQGHACRAYHGFWQYLRLLGLGKTLSGLPDRYLAALAAFLDGWKRRGHARAPSVLISGCADYSALAHVLHACRRAGIDARITALDLCATPLELNRWYAARMGVQIRTVEGNILDQTDDGSFDLILTSSFLGYFEPASRARLFDSYSRLLRRDGWVVFANRLRAEPEDTPIGFSAEQSARFAARAALLSADLPAGAAMSAAEAARAAEAYAMAFRSYPLNAAATVRALAEASGLRWLAGDAAPTRAHAAAVAGPTMSDGADYLFVRLAKP